MRTEWLASAAVALAIALWGLPSTATGESLADVAARERARRERSGTAKAGAVLTEDDLEASRVAGQEKVGTGETTSSEGEAQSEATPGAAPVDDADADAAEGVVEDAPVLDRDAERRTKTAEIRVRYKQAEREVERARAELKAARAERAKYPSIPPVYSGEVYGPIVRAQRRVKRAETLLTSAENHLGEIEDEARRAGVYPGDLRD